MTVRSKSIHTIWCWYIVLLVNILKGNNTKWNDESEFDANKDKTQFRQYEDACDRVKGFYKEQHGTRLILRYSNDLRRLISSHTENQTMAFNINVRVQFKTQKRARMSVWEAMEMLNTLVDESDPDVRCLSFSSLIEILRYILNRRASPKSSTYFKRLKPSAGTESLIGCKLQGWSTILANSGACLTPPSDNGLL